MKPLTYVLGWAIVGFDLYSSDELWYCDINIPSGAESKHSGGNNVDFMAANSNMISLYFKITCTTSSITLVTSLASTDIGSFSVSTQSVGITLVVFDIGTFVNI